MAQAPKPKPVTEPAEAPKADAEQLPADAKVNPAQDGVQRRVDEATEKGYFGYQADETPNRNYTNPGADLPTPETEREQA